MWLSKKAKHPAGKTKDELDYDFIKENFPLGMKIDYLGICMVVVNHSSSIYTYRTYSFCWQITFHYVKNGDICSKSFDKNNWGYLKKIAEDKQNADFCV